MSWTGRNLWLRENRGTAGEAFKEGVGITRREQGTWSLGSPELTRQQQKRLGRLQKAGLHTVWKTPKNSQLSSEVSEHLTQKYMFYGTLRTIKIP